MSWSKTESFKLTVYILKITSATAAVLSGLLCWMFSVSTAVSIGSINTPVTTQQREGLQTTVNISNNLAGITVWLFIISLAFAVIHFAQTKGHDKEAKNKLIGLAGFSIILIVSILLRANILRQLVVSS